KVFSNTEVKLYYNRVECAGEQSVSLEDLEAVAGETTGVVIPREAMGFGDVKFMAMIGAFLGWQAVIFTILAGSVTGALVGIFARITGKQEWSSRIPFGPFLALGAVVWMFYGWDLVRWYMNQFLG
ncbi:MAG: A24 family peptidase, partial [Verrucomicrobiales bacterium]